MNENRSHCSPFLVVPSPSVPRALSPINVVLLKSSLTAKEKDVQTYCPLRLEGLDSRVFLEINVTFEKTATFARSLPISCFNTERSTKNRTQNIILKDIQYNSRWFVIIRQLFYYLRACFTQILSCLQRTYYRKAIRSRTAERKATLSVTNG